MFISSFALVVCECAREEKTSLYAHANQCASSKDTSHVY